MTTQIATTPEQSARLRACGVDLSTADMCYIEFPNGQIQYNVGMVTMHANVFMANGKKIAENMELIGKPSWSFSALLALIPPCLHSPMGTEYRLELSTLRIHTEFEVQWFSGHDRWHPTDENGGYVRLWDKSPIEACVKAIEWLTLKGIKLNYNHDTDRY